MSIYAHQPWTAHRIHPARIDSSHVQCGRCGIIKTRPGQRDTTNYWCGDCKPYRPAAT